VTYAGNFSVVVAPDTARRSPGRQLGEGARALTPQHRYGKAKTLKVTTRGRGRQFLSEQERHRVSVLTMNGSPIDWLSIIVAFPTGAIDQQAHCAIEIACANALEDRTERRHCIFIEDSLFFGREP
jgi:hypothetical protein